MKNQRQENTKNKNPKGIYIDTDTYKRVKIKKKKKQRQNKIKIKIKIKNKRTLEKDTIQVCRRDKRNRSTARVYSGVGSTLYSQLSTPESHFSNARIPANFSLAHYRSIYL